MKRYIEKFILKHKKAKKTKKENEKKIEKDIMHKNNKITHKKIDKNMYIQILIKRKMK